MTTCSRLLNCQYHIPIHYPLQVFFNSSFCIQLKENLYTSTRKDLEKIQMASYSMNFTTQFLLALTILSSLHLLHVSCLEFRVGERNGWGVPPANETKLYNEWASKERFIIGDTIRFKYRKDSVMEVTESDYKNCNSTRPNFFSNTGNTIFTLDRSGFFYFISGATGHCRKGQRMIIRVMAQDQDSSSSAGCRNNAVITYYGILFLVISIQFVA